MSASEPVQLGSRRELFVDEYLLESMSDGASLRLHAPTPREAALVTDRPWEGSMSGYVTVFRDGDRVRMYYQGWQVDLGRSGGDGAALAERHPLWICYAESRDGLTWRRPDLGLIEHDGSRANNILWQGVGPAQHGVHGFSPHKDTNPACDPAARYKAVGADRFATQGDLYAVVSPDGIHWSLLRDEPILRHGRHGSFDSQNLVFWDTERGEYRIYLRDFRPHQDGRKLRDIKTATSPDFVHWTEPVWLDYPGAPAEELYTNQVQPYYRAPHLFVGFPTRYAPRPWSASIEHLPEPEHRRQRAAVSERFGTALTDGLFMSSRDGRTFHRWGEAFIPPGPQLEGNWAYGDNYQCRGMIETPSDLPGAPPDLSVLAAEGHWRGTGKTFRRYTLRVDGFVSIHAPRDAVEILSRPLTFDGARLRLNVATSAAGSVRVEIQDTAGKPIDGFARDECHPVIGDELDRLVHWQHGADVGRLAGRPVKLRFVIRDADLYALRFAPG